MIKIVKKGDCPYFEPSCGGCETDKINCRCPKLIAYEGVNDPKTKKEVLEELNVTSTTKFGTMLQMQSVFAKRFHPIENLSKSEIDKWTNEYLVCIEDEIIEAGEFLKIYNIKKYDEKEYRKELIDIVHFLMDGMCVAGITEQDFINIINCNDVDLLNYVVDKSRLSIRSLINMVDGNFDLARLYSLNYMLRDIRLIRQCISWKHWKKPNDTIDKEKITLAWYNMFSHLIDAFVLAGMSADDIYNIYVNKNVENILRQKAGY